MGIRLLSQEEADDMMKSLEGWYSANFYEAFHEERDKPREQRWALPPEKRLYYQVGSYLFGINRENLMALSLSSFARIDGTSPRGDCARCFKLLIEEKLIQLCREQNKKEINAQLSPGGVKVFEKLKSMMPGVSLGPVGYYTLGRIEIVI